MKTLRILSLALTMTLMITSIGCIRNNEIIRGNGNLTEEVRPVSSFSALDVSGTYSVIYSVADTFSLKISAESNLLSVIETKVENNRLEIQTAQGFTIRENQPMVVRITAPALAEIGMSGACDFVCNDTIEVNNFQADLSGSCTLETGVIANQISSDISGSGTVKITAGTSQSSNYNISGSATIDARQHITQNADVEISGSGRVWLHVIENLKVNISGSGEVNYFGDPIINSSISGSGRLNKL
ncbi:MAG: DUF2807 domain-containing protein [Saprospiraceae bacterium]|nr:DUF2807 domain-containing protein [Saprospiraceae bacterium]